MFIIFSFTLEIFYMYYNWYAFILKSEMYYQIIYIEVFIFFPVALQWIMYKVEIICRIPKIRKQLYEYGSNILI